jgi:hypothetical protein
MRHAADIGLVSSVAVTQALQITQAAGDVAFLLPHDAPSHGTRSERALAFMTGMNGGVDVHADAEAYTARLASFLDRALAASPNPAAVASEAPPGRANRAVTGVNAGRNAV